MRVLVRGLHVRKNRKRHYYSLVFIFRLDIAIMDKKSIILLFSAMICLSSCQVEPNASTHSSSIKKALESTLPLNSQYFSLLVKDEPMFMYFDWTDYDHQASSNFVKHRGFVSPSIISLSTLADQIVCKNKMPQIEIDNTDVLFNHTTTLGLKSSADSVSIADEWSTYEATVKVSSAKPITILNPDMSYWECTYPYVYSKDVELEWEADPDNANGVVIIASFEGLVLADEVSTMTPMYSATLVEDNGYAVLDNTMFEDMPEGAFVMMIMLRANIEDLVIDGDSPCWKGKALGTYLENVNSEYYSQTIHYASAVMSTFSFVLTHTMGE